MTAELVQQLARIQRHAAGLRSLVADGQAMAPRRARGTDRSGAVRVSLGPDGLPKSFRVAQDWPRMLAPEAFGDAVSAACQAATAERLAAWARSLEGQGWRAKAERLSDGPSDGLDERPAPVAPAHSRGQPGGAGARPLSEVAEDVIKALDAVQALASRPARPARAQGSAGAGKLVVTLSPAGLVACEADPQWVRGQSAARLANALGEALAAARARLPGSAGRPVPAGGSQPLGQVGCLLAEVLSLLDPQRRPAPEPASPGRAHGGTAQQG